MDFLERVAYKLREQHGGDMEKQKVVLPSRRAGLYLARYLSRLSDRPQWSPQMMTVGELFQSFTEIRPADIEIQIFELYGVYTGRFGREMTFDDFWSWGELIINDFNDIDLYLADADKLYSNISDLKEIDAKFGGLTDEQTEIVRSFWKSFNPGSSGSEARTKFYSVWKKLSALYADYRAVMMQKGLAGAGMLCREVAEKAFAGTLEVSDDGIWHIVGLNALNNCEKNLFRYLKATGKAKFYWDDAHFFMNDPDHKASVFMRENRRAFGNELDSDDTGDESVPEGSWQIIDTPSDTAQARMVSQVLENGVISNSGDLTDTAVILADEKLLMPVLTSLPPSVEDVNVTMGHPFRYTSLYSFLKQLMALVRSARISDGTTTFRSDEVIALLRHQYFRLLTGDVLQKAIDKIISGNMIRVDVKLLLQSLPVNEIFDVPAAGSSVPGYLTRVLAKVEEATFNAGEEKRTFSADREYIRMAMRSTVRIGNLIASYSLDLQIATCLRLIDRVLRKLIVPFSGEPLRGIQVMGVLETRALEFKNILFLSLNEGIFPRQSYDNTYIPYNIRRAFGLPTVNEHESIYAYYFFRLLRKPVKGWFIYNSSAQGLVSGEMSRYLVRMSYSPLFRTEQKSVHISAGRSRLMPERREKNEDHNRVLLDLYGTAGKSTKYLSPSAVNTWVNCRMRFYYRYVCNMPEEDRLEKDIDQRRFGNILHESLNRLYEPLRESRQAASVLKAMAADRKLIRDTIIATAASEMKWSIDTLMAGKGVIIIEVLEKYVTDLLNYDAEYGDLTLLNLEDDFHSVRSVKTGTGEKVQIRIGGRIDRVDITGGTMRVVDYKTGSPKRESVTPEDLFDEEKEKRNDAYMQALLYCSLMQGKHPGRIVIPAIYWVQQLSSRDFSPYAPVTGLDGPAAVFTDWESFMEAFTANLDITLNRIFSASEDYFMTVFERRCTFCPYKALCRR
jgi:hypothetical protein